jgi:beta-N-acetylglucosaminidase
MKTSDCNNEERKFSFSEVAAYIGLSEEEILRVAREEGLLDENGMPTEFAISEGFLAIEPILDATLNVN